MDAAQIATYMIAILGCTHAFQTWLLLSPIQFLDAGKSGLNNNYCQLENANTLPDNWSVVFRNEQCFSVMVQETIGSSETVENNVSSYARAR